MAEQVSKAQEVEPVTWLNFDERFPQLVAQVSRMEEILEEVFGPKGGVKQ